MRITGGALSGRLVRAPSGPVRPTQDKVRLALFSILGARVAEARFLDLFAGSGAVGLDAWSRGAAAVCWVEADRRVARGLHANVRALCGPEAVADGRARVIQGDVFRCLPPAGGAEFDIVFADPPYDVTGEHQWAARLAARMTDHGTMAPDGLMILEQSRREATALPPAWECVADRTYGETRLRLLRRPPAAM